MASRLGRDLRSGSFLLGVLTLCGVAVLFAWDAVPSMFPPRAHDLLGAFPLFMIAIAYLLHKREQTRGLSEWTRVAIVVAAFLFWAANQFWPDGRSGTVLNDIAIGLFVVDVFLVLAGTPTSGQDCSTDFPAEEAVPSSRD